MLLLTLPLSVFASKIYSWHDERGILIFSDIPKLDAEEVSIRQVNTIKSLVNTPTVNIVPHVIADNYKIDIIQPTPNATIRDNTGVVYVSSQVKPVLKHGFSVQLYLDNKPHKKPQTNTTFSLQNIDRGEHQIKIILLEDKGKVIATSSVITFYMHRSSINRAN